MEVRGLDVMPLELLKGYERDVEQQKLCRTFLECIHNKRMIKNIVVVFSNVNMSIAGKR